MAAARMNGSRLRRGRPAFIMPHYARDRRRWTFLAKTLKSLQDQSDPEWTLIITDDGSPEPGTGRMLDEVVRSDPQRVIVLRLPEHRGTGAARNAALEVAADLSAPFVLFQDDDDLAHPRRLEITSARLATTHEGFLYSGLIPIDENDAEIERREVRMDMLEVLEALDAGPVVGEDAWIEIATRTGFIATTSTVAVPTKIALQNPFPERSVSEDSHTWLRMSAAGAAFGFVPEIPVRYRIDSARNSGTGANGRGLEYLEEKVRIDIDGFFCAARNALARARVSAAELEAITRAFYLRLGRTVRRQGGHAIAAQLQATSSSESWWSPSAC